VLIDLAGVYAEDLTRQDPNLVAATSNLRALLGSGTFFQNYYVRHRDHRVSAYQLLTGSYPVRIDLVPFTDADPAVTLPPGYGQLKLPFPDDFVNDPAGYDAWRSPGDFGQQTVFDVVKAGGGATQLLGELDGHDQHYSPASIDSLQPGSGEQAVAALPQALQAASGGGLVVVGLGRAATRRDARVQELARIDGLVGQVKAAIDGAPGTLLVAVSRPGAPVAPGQVNDTDLFGPQSGRHGVLLVVGPNARPGVVVSDPAEPVDVAPTLLFGLGATGRTDLLRGLTLDGGTGDSGEPLPSPRHALGARVQVRAFDVVR
jgi:hypothetical protein